MCIRDRAWMRRVCDSPCSPESTWTSCWRPRPKPAASASPACPRSSLGECPHLRMRRGLRVEGSWARSRWRCSGRLSGGCRPSQPLSQPLLSLRRYPARQRRPEVAGLQGVEDAQSDSELPLRRAHHLLERVVVHEGAVGQQLPELQEVDGVGAGELAGGERVETEVSLTIMF